MATKAALLAVTLVLSAGCAAGGGEPGGSLAPDVAAGLAGRAEQVAADLDQGRCDQALAGARSLQSDIAALPADAAVRAEALAGAARLLNVIACPPAITPTSSVPVTTPDSEKRPKGKGHKGNDDDD